MTRDLEAQAFWMLKSPKIWVVDLEVGPSYALKRDTMIVRARDEAGAVRTAKLNTSLYGDPRATARLAHPVHDLGCVPTPERAAA